MRNGNDIFCSMVLSAPGSSYPTYEEWKHERTVWACVQYRVLILPMRNGNTGEPVPTHIPGFGSYPTYEEWKP